MKSTHVATISDKSYAIHARPKWDDHGLVICNFKANEKVHLIYETEGPHIRLNIPSKNFLTILEIGTSTTFRKNDGLNIGHIEMLTGYPACDLGHGLREIEELTITTYRQEDQTRFSLSGIASEPLDRDSDTGSQLDPKPVVFSLSFDVPDFEIAGIFPEQNDQFMFRSLVRRKLGEQST